MCCALEIRLSSQHALTHLILPRCIHFTGEKLKLREIDSPKITPSWAVGASTEPSSVWFQSVCPLPFPSCQVPITQSKSWTNFVFWGMTVLLKIQLQCSGAWHRRSFPSTPQIFISPSHGLAVPVVVSHGFYSHWNGRIKKSKKMKTFLFVLEKLGCSNINNSNNSNSNNNTLCLAPYQTHLYALSHEMFSTV